jgi:hypothetical protein
LPKCRLKNHVSTVDLLFDVNKVTQAVELYFRHFGNALPLGATMSCKQLLTISLFVFTNHLLAGCSLSDQQLKRGWWKYGEGYHLGDVVDFNHRFSISGDTILQNGKAVAVIIDRKKGIFGDDNEIQIRSLDKKESGVYHQK